MPRSVPDRVRAAAAAVPDRFADPRVRNAMQLADAIKGFDGDHPGDDDADVLVPHQLWKAWLKLAREARDAR